MMVVWLIVIVLLFIGAGYVYTRYVDAQLHNTYPATGMFTDVSGGVIHWSRSVNGNADNKPPLILIHGLAGNMHNFGALEARLRASFTVYCLDRPGSGHARRLVGTDASFDEQSRMISEWMDKVQLPNAVVVGHSMGGGIALSLALNSPQRVAGLALIAPLAAPLDIRVSRFTKWALKRAWFRLFAAKVLMTAFRKRYSRQQVNAIFAPEPPRSNFASEFGGDLSMHSGAFFAASADLASAQRSLYSQYQHYHSIRCPVGVIYGDGDRVLAYRHHMGHIQKALPDAECRLLKGRGHMIPITAVDECASLIDAVADKAMAQTH